MPSYELLLLIKKLQKPELSQCIKRAATLIFENKGILRKIEYLGLQPLHFRKSSSIRFAPRFNSANFVLYHLDLSPDAITKINEDCRADNDIIRSFYIKKELNFDPLNDECTLSEELKPPALRKSVQYLIEQGRRKKPIYDMGDDINVQQIS